MTTGPSERRWYRHRQSAARSHLRNTRPRNHEWRHTPSSGWLVAVPAGPPAQPLAGPSAFSCQQRRRSSSVARARKEPLSLSAPSHSCVRPRPPLADRALIACGLFAWQAPPPRDESEYVTVAERPQGLKIVRPPIWRRPRKMEDEGKSTFNVHHDAVQARIAAEVVRFPKLPVPTSTIFQTSYGNDAVQFIPSGPLGMQMCVRANQEHQEKRSCHPVRQSDLRRLTLMCCVGCWDLSSATGGPKARGRLASAPRDPPAMSMALSLLRAFKQPAEICRARRHGDRPAHVVVLRHSFCFVRSARPSSSRNAQSRLRQGCVCVCLTGHDLAPAKLTWCVCVCVCVCACLLALDGPVRRL
jgi:hypothetical protein